MGTLALDLAVARGRPDEALKARIRKTWPPVLAFALGAIASLPTCDERRRGEMRRVEGGAGVADHGDGVVEPRARLPAS